jgi:hypothetical protein
MSRRVPFSPEDNLPVHDFLSEGIVWNPLNFPWFNVTVSIEGDTGNSFMVPSLDQLKRVLAKQNPRLKVESIDYVTPGCMNGSGHWKMEPLVEVTELFNDFGWSIPRCRVNSDRVYRGISLEPADEWKVERVVYTAPQA